MSIIHPLLFKWSPPKRVLRTKTSPKKLGKGFNRRSVDDHVDVARIPCRPVDGHIPEAAAKKHSSETLVNDALQNVH